MREKWIWFDMDGTFVDFYGVEGWLDDLMVSSTRPYEVAKPLYKITDFINMIFTLRAQGYKIGVISWSSKARDESFDKLVRVAKEKWLNKYMISNLLDEFIVTQYGVCKADTCRKFGSGILVDDEEPNRNAWDLGRTINANENIIKELLKI